MYTPEHFAVGPEDAAAFLAGVQAADLITMTDEGLRATFLPLLFDPGAGALGALRGHLARKNDQWKQRAHGDRS